MIGAYTYLCSRNIGGNRYLLLTEAYNITSIVITDSEITDIVMTGSLKLIEADQDTIIRLCEGDNRTFYHSVLFNVKNRSLETNELSRQLKIASRNGMAAIVLDNNDKMWLVGVDLRNRKFGPGLAMIKDELESNLNIRTYELKTVTNYNDLPFNSDLVDYVKDKIDRGFTSIDFGYLDTTEEITVDYPITVDAAVL